MYAALGVFLEHKDPAALSSVAETAEVHALRICFVLIRIQAAEAAAHEFDQHDSRVMRVLINTVFESSTPQCQETSGCLTYWPCVSCHMPAEPAV